MSGETGIVLSPQSSIEETFDPTAFFDGVVDADTAKAAVEKVKALEDMLKIAEQLGEYASQFCELEAKTFVRISEVPNAEKKLTGLQKEIVAWLRTKSGDEIDSIVSECATGVRLRVVFRRENHRQRYSQDDELNSIARRIITEAKELGRTTLTRQRFYDESDKPERLKKSTVDAYVELTRDELRSDGILGIGDNKGTYVSLVGASRSDVADIVRNVLNAALASINKLKKLCDAYNVSITEDGAVLLKEAVDGLL